MFNMIANTEVLKAGDYIFFGGIVGKDGAGRLVKDFDVAAQTEAVIRRMESFLRPQALGLADLAFVTVYLPDMRYYNQMNEAYIKAMPAPLPPRKLVVTPLVVPGAVVEMTGVAYAGEKKVLFSDL